MKNIYKEYIAFMKKAKNVYISSVDENTKPEISYSPCVIDDNKNVYILVSDLSKRTSSLVQGRNVSLMFIEPEEQEVPTNFTVFSASAGKETAKILEEAEHGLFSYYLMKGLEGEADSNSDNQITNGELIAFINKNVSRQANQTPQLNGDPDQVLVQW